MNALVIVYVQRCYSKVNYMFNYTIDANFDASFVSIEIIVVVNSISQRTKVPFKFVFSE